MYSRNVIGCICVMAVIAAQAQTPSTASTAKAPQNTAVQQQQVVQPPAAAAPVQKQVVAAPVAADQTGGITVKRAAIALDIEEHEPKDTGSFFPSEIKRLYCFTEIGNGEGQEIQHRWYWNDDMLSAIPLKVTSNRHRTYSAKTIVPGMVGEWKVAIVNSRNEAVLKMLTFTVK